MNSAGRLFLAIVLTVAALVVLIAHYAGAGADGIGYGIVLAILIILYLLPSYVGYARLCPSKHAIFALNLFLGWTLIGWVASLVWALRNYRYSATNEFLTQQLRSSRDISFETPKSVRQLTPIANTLNSSSGEIRYPKQVILKFLMVQDQPCTIGFISHELEISAEETHKVLDVLVESGLVQTFMTDEGNVLYGPTE